MIRLTLGLASALLAIACASSDAGGASPTPASNDAGPSDVPAVDGGVHEEQGPACHDLTQVANEVKTTATMEAAPKPVPIQEIPPGTYVVTEVTDYGMEAPMSELPTQITVVFTPTRQYFAEVQEGGRRGLTLDWKLENGNLVRTIVCVAIDVVFGAAPGKVISYPVGASPNGFSAFIDFGNDKTEVIRYERRL
jgi:hypothetical protein